LQRYENGSVEATSLFIDDDTGDIEIEANLDLTSSSPTLTVGDGSGSPILYLDGGEDGSNDPIIRFATTGSHQWSIQQDESAGSNLRVLRYINGSFQATTLDIDRSGNITMEADLTLDSDSPTLTVGNGTGGVPRIAFDKPNGDVARWDFMDNGVVRWRIQHHTNEDLIWNRLNSAGGDQHTFMTMDVDDGTMRLEADLSLTSSAPTLTVGDGTGAVEVVLDSSSDNADIRFREGGTEFWSLAKKTSGGSPGFVIERYDNGVFEADSLFIAESDGDINIEANLSLTSSSPILTVGNGSDGSPEVALDQVANASGSFTFGSAGSTPALRGGVGEPSDDAGNDGDFYFRADGSFGNGAMYMKLSGSWTSLVT